MTDKQYKLLIDQVKRKLNITWNEEETNNRIDDIVKEAIPKIKSMIGITNDSYDFSQYNEEHNLFVNYCFYEWNNSANDFKSNYRDDIMSLRHKYEIETLKEENE